MVALFALSAFAEEKLPNIVLIMCDDLGYGDVQCLNPENGKIQTPHIDQLAGEGMTFTDVHSGSSVCTPTRYGLLTGRCSWRTRLQNGVGQGFVPCLIAPDRLTVAGLLKQQGYATGIIGKWHMSVLPETFPSPKDQGFVWVRRNTGSFTPMRPHRLTGFATKEASDPYRLDENGFSTHQNSEDALTFIQENKDKAFFLYYATFMVHTPIQTRTERLLEKYCEKLGVELPENPNEWSGPGQTNPFYCAMVEGLDYYVCKIFDYLESTEDPRWPGHKLSENTYLIFTSDNGGMERVPGEIITDNYPLDRGKISAMEGGVRVPLIITGPGIEAGQQSDVMINGLDFYPTILSWTGTKPPVDKHFDGCDLSTLLERNPADPSLVRELDGSVRDTMVWHFPNSVALESTIRIGDYKLIRNYDHRYNTRTPELELYQLYATQGGKKQRVDIEESKNLAEAMPERAQAIDRKLDEILSEMMASYPYYNPYFKFPLPGKETVSTVLSHRLTGSRVTCRYKENGAKVRRANLIYTLNGGERAEEWFRMSAELVPGGKITAVLPEGTTHYVFNLIDENNFLVSYPDMVKPSRAKPASLKALAVK
jgi:uncharacterized sulfatase